MVHQLSSNMDTVRGNSLARQGWQKLLDRLSIRQKLLWGYGLALGVAVCGITSGIAIGGYQYRQAILKTEIIDRQANLLYDFQGQLLAMQIYEGELANLQGRLSTLKYGPGEILDHAEKITSLLNEFKAILQKDPNLIQGFDSFLLTHSSTLEHYIERLKKTLAKAEQLSAQPGSTQQIRFLLKDFQASAEATSVGSFAYRVTEFTDKFRKLQGKAAQAQSQAKNLERQIIVGSLLLSISMAVLLSLLISRAIAQPIGSVTEMAEQITREKNFELQVPVTGADEIGSLGRSFNHLILEVNHLISEQTQTAKKLDQAKQAAEAANASKSEFLASMSHELRTPLNGVLGYAQILQRDPHLLAKQQEGVAIIHQCASHLLTLINDILDLSKIEAGRMEMELNDFHLLSLLQGVGEMCRVRAEQKGIAFIYQPSSQLPEGIYGDERRLRQVLLNLLGNAIKFTDQGEVTLQVTPIAAISPASSDPLSDPSGEQSPEEAAEQLPQAAVDSTESLSLSSQGGIHKIRFQVTDTGVGMTPEQLERIFLPFEQVGNQQRKAEGTGLGLAISQKIVQMMGSSIQVTSALGQGSAFWMDIDLLEAVDWSRSNRIMAQGRIMGYLGSSKKILVVDDKWENRSIIIRLLDGLGFGLAEANNGEEGLAQAELFRPDLILVDLVMPVMDGFEFCRRLRRLPQFQATRIIATSASVFESEKQKCFDGGADDFLAKPIQVVELFNKLKTHLQVEWLHEVVIPSFATEEA